MPSLEVQSCMYVARMMGSPMTLMLCMMLEMASARFTGSLTPLSNTCVLNCMKSVLLSSMYWRNSSAVCFLAKESGSSPSGSSITFTFMPSLSSMSVPRSAALMPAASPS